MRLTHGLRAALDSLRAQKLRAFLTMLGIIIGISAVIAMVSLTEGLRYAVVHEFEAMGTDLIFVAWSPEEGWGKRQVFEGLTMEDAEAMKDECKLLGDLTPQIDFKTEVRHGNKERQVRVVGVMENANQVNNLAIAEGRPLTREDIDGWRRVCVIGDKVAKDFFDEGGDPVGQELRFGGIRFRIIGVLEKKGGGMDPNRQADDVIHVPLTAMQKRLIGSDIVGVIFAKALRSDKVKDATDQIWRFLWRRHENIEDFVVDSQASMLKSFGRVLTIISFVVGGVVGISLLVGGIGIMNIMLVTVTERTKEIGLRKALGAKRRDILIQFLIEAMTLSAIGGALGVAVGWGLSKLVGHAITKAEALPFTTHVPLWSVLLALGFSSAVGLFFGLWPAYRAACLDPIEALRVE